MFSYYGSDVVTASVVRKCYNVFSGVPDPCIK